MRRASARRRAEVEARMGKAAENEKRKLLATLCNNLAVAALGAGFIIPWFSLYSNKKIRTGSFFTFAVLEEFKYAIGAVGFAVLMALILHTVARLIADGIED